MLLGPSADHTWSVLGEPIAATPICVDCATAWLTAASGMVPSALARCQNIHSSAPNGFSAAAGVRAPSAPECVTDAAPVPKRIMMAVAARIGTWVLLRRVTRALHGQGGAPAPTPGGAAR